MSFGYLKIIFLLNMWIKMVFELTSVLIVALKMHVSLSVDLNKLPPEAWEKRKGLKGEYHRVRYYLGLTFGAGGIEWRFLYQGKVIGSAECKYS
jgi:hypothetical protein